MTARSAAGDALRARIRYIVDRTIARARIKPLTGTVTGPEAWRRDVGAAMSDLRLFLIGSRPRSEYQNMLIRGAIAECARQRIESALKPIFAPVARVEWQLRQIASIQREPWAHPQHAVNQ